MVDERITIERVDELLRFLPLFDVPGRPYVRAWSGAGQSPGHLEPPHVEYREDVMAFFWLAGQTCWSDFKYDPRQAQARLVDDQFIHTCSLDELKTLLTYCVRSERFADGAWLNQLQSGRIVALLERLAVLRESF